MALIVTILSVVVAATITMAIVTGMVYGEEDIPDQLYYGEPISYSANSFISKIAYEYGYLNPDGAVMWSDDQPQYPGMFRI